MFKATTELGIIDPAYISHIKFYITFAKNCMPWHILEVNFTIDQLFCWNCSWINQLIYYTWCTINLNWFRETHLLHGCPYYWPAFVKWKSTFQTHIRFGQFWLFSKYSEWKRICTNLLKWNEMWLLMLFNSGIFAVNVLFMKVSIISIQKCAPTNESYFASFFLQLSTHWKIWSVFLTLRSMTSSFVWTE